MGNAVIALFVAAGLSAFVYSKLGRRVGYGNGQQVWTLVAITFVMTFVIILLLAGAVLPD